MEMSDQKGLLLDATPLSLGIEWPEGAYKGIIFRDSPIPICRSHLFVLVPGVEKLVIRILQGERLRVEDNHLLGTFEVLGLSLSTKQQAVEVFFNIDANGILSITAQAYQGDKLEVKITATRGLTRAQIDEMRREIATH
jgi:heat shock protein 5